MPRDAPQAADVVDAPERRGPHRFVRRALGHGGQVLLIVEPAQRQCRVAVALGRRGGHRDQAIDAALAAGLVLLAAREADEDPRPPSMRAWAARRTPDVLVAGQLDERPLLLGVVGGQLVDRRRTDGRRRRASTGLGLKRSRKDMAELTVTFLCEPLGDLLARQAVVVVEVDDHRGQRQPLAAARPDSASSPRRDSGTAARDDRGSACRGHAAGGRRRRRPRRGRTTRPGRRSSCRSTGGPRVEPARMNSASSRCSWSSPVTIVNLPARGRVLERGVAPPETNAHARTQATSMEGAEQVILETADRVEHCSPRRRRRRTGRPERWARSDPSIE